MIRNWLEGLNPFCNPEVIRQLGLPELGCDETADGTAGGGGFGPGSGIIDPIDALCSEYDTGPMSGLLARNPNRGFTYGINSVTSEINGNVQRTVQTTDWFDSETGDWLFTEKMISEHSIINPDAVNQTTFEMVFRDGYGIRTTITHYADGTSTTQKTEFRVAPEDVKRPNYDENKTNPPPQDPPAGTTTGGNEGGNSPNQGNPGPEGSDIAVAEFCRARANHRSGIEQAVSQDPTSINVSCGDLAGAPSRNCSIIEWARPEDFIGVMEPPDTDDTCDEFNNPDRGCEGASVEDRIRRFLGRGATLWSLDLPALDICPRIVCDPAEALELQTYTAGNIDLACPVLVEAPVPTPTLEPSEDTCPPGTYYAPATNRCIPVKIATPKPGGGDGGGGNTCQPPPGGCAANEY